MCDLLQECLSRFLEKAMESEKIEALKSQLSIEEL